ncbi:MAG: CBS domain-containing protein [Thermoplasmatales archaeon]|nr:CBS domain-containing protein [Thermoplasmatales archaeon]
MKVKDIMTKGVIYVNKRDDVDYILQLMGKYKITKAPVIEDGKIVGIVTDNEIADKLGSIRSRGVTPARLRAMTVMEKKFDVVSPDTPIEEILETVGEPGPTMLPVVSNEHLVGVVTKADLLPLVEGDENIKEIMTFPVISVSREDRVIHARRLMIDKNIARIPVVENGKVIGIISDWEIANAFAKLKKGISLGKQGSHIKNLLVGDVMKSPAITAKDTITIKEAAQIMMKNEVGCLPIVGGDEKIKGIVTRTDLLKHLLKKLKQRQ